MKSSNPSQSKTDIPIPEPRHRVGPKGVSSGISFRNLPPPSLDEIKKVCEHYQEKCSGTYKSLASRYVYQMATEIEDLVDVMQGESSGSEASFPKKRFHRPGADKENATQVPRCEKRSARHTAKPLTQVARSSSESSSRSDRNARQRNAATNEDARLPKHRTTEKERRRWRKEFHSELPDQFYYVAAEKERRRMKGHRFARSDRVCEESLGSSAWDCVSSDEDSSVQRFMPTKPKSGRKHRNFESQNDNVLRWLMEEGHKPHNLGSRHEEVLRWLKEEMDRSQNLIQRSKQMHDRELESAKKELEKVKKAAKIIIKAVHKKGKDRAAKLEANVQSERRQRVKSQKIVESLIKSQTDQLHQLRRVAQPENEMFYSGSDVYDLMGNSDLTSVLDELAEEAFQQSYCS